MCGVSGIAFYVMLVARAVAVSVTCSMNDHFSDAAQLEVVMSGSTSRVSVRPSRFN